MIFPKRQEIISTDLNKTHPDAWLPNRRSTFYDKVLADEFKKHFKFISQSEDKKLIKKKI